MPEKQIPETPPELDPNINGHETEGHDLHYEEQAETDQPVSSGGSPIEPDKTIQNLIESAAEDDESDDDDADAVKSKKKKLTKRLHVRRKKAVRSLSDIFAESRRKQKRYKDMLKSSFHEGKRKAHHDKEARRSKAKRKSRIINAIKRNRVRNNDIE